MPLRRAFINLKARLLAARSRKSPKRIFVRYGLGIALSATLALALVDSLQTWFSYRETLANLTLIQQAETKAAAISIEGHLQTLESEIQQLATLPWSTGLLTEVHRREEFDRLLKLIPAVMELTAISSEGRERLRISRLGNDSIGSNADRSKDEEFVRARASTLPTYGRVYFLDGSEPYCTLRLWERNGGGDLLVARLNLHFLVDVVAGLTVGQGGSAYVVDTNDHIIAHPDVTVVLKHTDAQALSQVRAARDALALLATGTLPTVWGHSPDGRVVLASARQIRGPGWLLIVEQSRSEVLAPVWAALTRTMLVLALGLLFSVAASVLLAKRLSNPVLAVQRGAMQIAAGNLSARLNVHTGDEIESLANEFNRMAERLEESHRGLEGKVTLRTKELSEATAQVQQQAGRLELLNAELHVRLEELAHKTDDAERANAAMTRFLAAASHDLRQPMHTISLLVGILRERAQTPDTTGLVDKVHMSVQSMENLFNSLLDISKLDAGAVQPNIADCELGMIMRLIEANYGPQAHEKGLILNVVPTRVTVRSDPVLLERIIGNLVANAIRYTVHGKILVGCRRRATSVRILIIDTGVGIPAAHMDDIFEEFFQLANIGRDRSKGLGLGLSIVKRSVELLGHSLIVESQLGKGSTFGVELPFVRRQAKLPSSTSIPDLQFAGLNSAFVVVIDDEPENRFAMEALCIQWNCHVVAAGSIEEALEKLKDHLRTPDLIVTDYLLRQNQTGLMAIESIRKQTDEATPAIVVTGDISAVDTDKLSRAGFALLHKPVNPDKLRQAMQRLLADTTRSE